MSLVYTLGDLIEATYDVLLANRPQPLTSLAQPLADGATDVYLTSTGTVSEGSYLGIKDELLYVQSVNESARSCVAIRNVRATTNENGGPEPTHPAGTVVDVDPAFPRHAVRRALRMEVQSWPDDLFYDGDDPKTFEVYDASKRTYLPKPGYDGFDEDDVVLAVWVKDHPHIRPDWLILPEQATNVQAATSRLIAIDSDIAGADIEVKIGRRPKTTSSLWTVLMDDETLVGPNYYMKEEWFDIAMFGAAWRLMSGRDIGRASIDSQPQPRSAEEVPPGFAASTATFLKRQRDARLHEEIIKLKARWPLRRH